MRLIQISDIHIGETGEDTRGVDVRKNFLQVLESIRDEQPDVLMLTGDLCYKSADPEIYEWVCRHVNGSDFEVLVLNGNHDEANLLARCFGMSDELKNGELYYRRKLNGLDILCLDTGRAVMSENQYGWIADQLNSFSKGLIFMHHPPMLCGVPFMDDNHPFRESNQLMGVLQSNGMKKEVFCGHYHVDKIVSTAGMSIYLTPSTFFQIDQSQEDFAVDHYNIAYRIIDTKPSGFETRLVWSSGNKL